MSNVAGTSNKNKGCVNKLIVANIIAVTINSTIKTKFLIKVKERFTLSFKSL